MQFADEYLFRGEKLILFLISQLNRDRRSGCLGFLFISSPITNKLILILFVIRIISFVIGENSFVIGEEIMKFILGKKISSSQIFNEKGNVIPVTLVQAEPCFVAQVKNSQKDGYESVQIGLRKTKKANKAQKGHLQKAKEANSNVSGAAFLREFKTEKDQSFNIGDEIKVDIFKEGEIVKVTGISKGKGFQGVVKRHGFGGGPKSHGQKHRLRAPGSIGATFPERVPKGRRMAGRMGAEQVTVRGLEIVKIDSAANILAIKGAVPGNKGTLLKIISQ